MWIIGVVLFNLSATISVIAYPSGSPAGYTGSPGDGQHCVSCHGGSAATVAGWITSNIPTAGYTAGTVYTITVTVSGSGKKGFEVSPQNVTGTQLGILAAGTGSHLVGGTKYVTQNASGSTSSTVIWTFTWTAPVAGTGDVTFYGAFCVGKSSTKLSTLVVSENAVLPLSATASANPALVCAGQSSQLNVIPEGGSGTYTFAWTSIPPGFTSSLQNPVVTPNISTQYIAHVTDGALSADAPANVTVIQPPSSFAGDDTTCAFTVTQVSLNGSATDFSTVLWTTSGTGSFSAANDLAGNYFPSAGDKTGGNVTLTLTASAQSPCTTAATDTRIITFDGPTGIATILNKKISLVISPNPTNGLFNLQVNGIGDRDAILTISDLTGRAATQLDLKSFHFQKEQIDLTGYPKGLYFVRIQTKEQSVITKLVIN